MRSTQPHAALSLLQPVAPPFPGPLWSPALLCAAFPEFEPVACTFQFMPVFSYSYSTLFGRPGIRVPFAWQPGPGAQASVAVARAAAVLGVAGLGGLLARSGDFAPHPYAVFVQEILADLFGSADLGD